MIGQDQNPIRPVTAVAARRGWPRMMPLVAMASTMALAAALAYAGPSQDPQGEDASKAVKSRDQQPVVVKKGGPRPIAKRPDAKASGGFFTGSASVDRIFPATDPSRLAVSNVTFEPGARTIWHSHPLGQTLIVTDGIGWVQGWGGKVQEIRSGDIVRIPPNQKHWHGATATTGMTHVSIVEHLDGRNVEGLERVSDEQYRP